MENSSSRAKILQTVIDMIGKEKHMRPTVREIAARAKVNTAAINYYFQTKENLFLEAEGFFARMLADKYAILNDRTVPLPERLMDWAESMMSFMMEYPGVLLIFGAKVFEEDSRDLNAFITAAEDMLSLVLQEQATSDTQEEIPIKVQQLMACVIYPVLIQSGIRAYKNLDLKDPSQRARYLKSVIRSFVPGAELPTKE